MALLQSQKIWPISASGCFGLHRREQAYVDAEELAHPSCTPTPIKVSGIERHCFSFNTPIGLQESRCSDLAGLVIFWLITRWQLTSWQPLKLQFCYRSVARSFLVLLQLSFTIVCGRMGAQIWLGICKSITDKGSKCACSQQAVALGTSSIKLIT